MLLLLRWLLLPMLLGLMVPNRVLLRLLLVDRLAVVLLLLLRLPHNSLLNTLRLARRGRPERGHGGLRGGRLHRHRLPTAHHPARRRARVLQGHNPHRLPVGHLYHPCTCNRMFFGEVRLHFKLAWGPLLAISSRIQLQILHQCEENLLKVEEIFP